VSDALQNKSDGILTKYGYKNMKGRVLLHNVTCDCDM
jgi:hypothetical protein